MNLQDRANAMEGLRNMHVLRINLMKMADYNGYIHVVQYYLTYINYITYANCVLDLEHQNQ